jgi:sterol desaturase/sphingolipid hydroxylase (fatty acid hydroxylase superfamily)
MWLYHQITAFHSPDRAAFFANALAVWLHRLTTLPGLEAVIAPIFPLLLLVEAAFLVWVNRRSLSSLSRAYKVPALMHVTNIVLSAVINLQVFLWAQRHFSAIAPFEAGVGWLGFVYAFLVWELSHFLFHYSCHNVRLLWTVHAAHHAPNHMNLSVIYSGSVLETMYANLVRTMICSVLGVPLPLLVLVMAIDACWGALIHMSEELWPSGALGGKLGRLILSPRHHRIHHATNAEYIDKNYCNTLPIWDLAFGTFQAEIPGVRPRYGLARKVRENSFLDMYFGEMTLLMRDMVKAPSFKAMLLYPIMPPGWQPVKAVGTAGDQPELSSKSA